MKHFEKNLEQAIQKIAQGKNLEEVVLNFPLEDRGEAREILKIAQTLFESKNSFQPAEATFRAFLNTIPSRETQQKKVSFTQKIFLAKMPWRFGVPVTLAFAMCMILLLGMVRLRSLDNTLQGESAKNAANEALQSVPEMSALSVPIPAPDANVDNAVSALLSDMNQEASVLNAEASAVKSNVDQSTVLPTTYDPSQI
jgi:hypothetical protein